MTGQDAVSALLDRVRDWWRRQGELSVLGNMEIGRVAEDLRISTDTLRDLVARGPEAANLLYERMQALGISKADASTRLPRVSCGICKGRARAATRRACARRTWRTAQMIQCGRTIVQTPSHSNPFLS